MDDRDELLRRVAKLETIIAGQAEIISRRADRIAEPEAEWQRRGKRYRPKLKSAQVKYASAAAQTAGSSRSV
ncbi:MAG: hypothetical protein AB7I48_14495 [Planctomycetaceae bacterium]